MPGNCSNLRACCVELNRVSCTNRICVAVTLLGAGGRFGSTITYVPGKVKPHAGLVGWNNLNRRIITG